MYQDFASALTQTRSVNYLLKYRIRWGEPDRLTLLPSALSLEEQQGSGCNGVLGASINAVAGAAENAKEEQYFKADTPPNLVSIIQNDWPYSGKASASFISVVAFCSSGIVMRRETVGYVKLLMFQSGPSNIFMCAVVSDFTSFCAMAL